MKRSEINAIIARAEADFAQAGFHLPSFGCRAPGDWQSVPRAELDDIRATALGWDVTDFGDGEFLKKGLTLFTMRNGVAAGGPMNRPYAEKIMVARRDQLTPMHRHASKIEDIINRSSLGGNGRLALKFFAMDEKGSLVRDRSLVVNFDGRARELAPGTVVELLPGESVTVFPGTFHAFWGEGGDVVIGEVSTINDDAVDNFFPDFAPIGRFPTIEEDEAPYRLIVTDYAKVGA